MACERSDDVAEAKIITDYEQVEIEERLSDSDQPKKKKVRQPQCVALPELTVGRGEYLIPLSPVKSRRVHAGFNAMQGNGGLLDTNLVHASAQMPLLIKGNVCKTSVTVKNDSLSDACFLWPEAYALSSRHKVTQLTCFFYIFPY